MQLDEHNSLLNMDKKDNGNLDGYPTEDTPEELKKGVWLET